MKFIFDEGMTVRDLKELIKDWPDTRPDGEFARVLFESNGYGLDEATCAKDHLHPHDEEHERGDLIITCWDEDEEEEDE